MKLDDELRPTEEYIPDAFDKRIRDGLEAAYDSESISVSEELIQRTLKAIDRVAAGESDRAADASEGLKKSSRPGRNKVIGIVTTIAAGFVLVFVGIRLVKMGVMTKDSAESAVTESASSTDTSGASGNSGQNTMADTAAPNFALDFKNDAGISDSAEDDNVNADEKYVFAEPAESEKAEAGADSFDETDNSGGMDSSDGIDSFDKTDSSDNMTSSESMEAPEDAENEAADGMILATISDMNDVLNGGSADELNAEQYKLIDSYLIDKQLTNTEYEEAEAQPLFAAVYNNGEVSRYIIVIDRYVLRVEYSPASQYGVLYAYEADDPLLIAEELKLEIGG